MSESHEITTEHERGPEREIQKWDNLFNLKFATEWMEEDGEIPETGALFGDFWLEGELSILFSDTNRGKSTLALQIAEALARGESIAPFEDPPPARRVLYFDFEMNKKQFNERYSVREEDGTRRHHKFSGNLMRAQMAPHEQLPSHFKNMTEFVQYSFNELLRQTGARVVIVDNITFLKGANENAAAAAQLMKALKHYKEYYGLSILVLAHTPKLPYTSPFSVNDMQGSKMLSNFADNIFALGASNQAKDLRYLKHLKPRGGELRYDVSNVILFRLKKVDTFLRFEFEGYAKERDHLVWRYDNSDGERAKLMVVAKGLHEQGASQRRVAMIMGIPPTTARRYIMAATPGDENILKETDLTRMQSENV
jgi:hypothetical protein